MFNLLIIIAGFITKPGLIFFTGGSNSMPKPLYNDFVKILESKFEVFKIDYNDEYISKIREIYNKNNNIMLLGHSSGCVTALNSCENNNLVSKIILLDPVKTPTFKREKDLDYLKKVLILDAELSYKWKEDFPYVPFIPFLKINNNDLSISEKKIRRIMIKNYGHTDLIDNPWRDIMHNLKISTGNNDRSYDSIKKYYKKLCKIFLIFYDLP